jgi:hypothetical protein
LRAADAAEQQSESTVLAETGPAERFYGNSNLQGIMRREPEFGTLPGQRSAIGAPAPQADTASSGRNAGQG